MVKLKLVVVLISFFLISIISLRGSRENAGLSSFATKNSFLGSPRLAERVFNTLISLAIFFYIAIAIYLNLMNHNF